MARPFIVFFTALRAGAFLPVLRFLAGAFLTAFLTGALLEGLLAFLPLLVVLTGERFAMTD